MASIDPTLYEAAKVDGAGRMRMIWHITLPGIRSIIILLFILKLGHLLDAGFDQIYILYIKSIRLQTFSIRGFIEPACSS